MTVISRLATALADRYHVERELGAGGMATVYLAHDLRHERDVAIKVLHPDLGAVLGGERFLAEIKTTAKLQHPHILPLLDSGVADGLLYYVMPFVEGETLRARLDRESQLSITDALQLASEIADALQYAHERGVIHRDIKPENILLQGGHALVADFGIALAVQQSGGARMTQTGLSLGTPQYMAPEQAMGERTVDARADVYALGAVTYEMLTGEPPFTGPTSQAIVARVLTVPPAPLTQTRSTVPPHVESAVLVSLQKLPADRFATVSDFAAALRAEGSGIRLHVAAAPSAGATTQRGIPPWLFAVACTGALAAAAWGWSRVPVESAGSALATRFTVTLPDSLRFSPLGAQQTVAVSPDGREFVFPAASDQLFLYRRRLDSLAITRVPIRIGFGNPVYAPDGRSLALQDFGGNLIQLPLDGGEPVLIDSGGARPSWGDNNRLLYLRDGKLRVLDGLGTAARTIELRGVGSKVTPSFPFLLPGGKAALVNLLGEDQTLPDAFEIAMVNLETGAATRLGVRGGQPRFVSPDLLLFTRQSQTLLGVTFDPARGSVSGTPRPVLEKVLVRTGGAAMYGVSNNGVLAYLTSGGVYDPVLVRNGTTIRFRLDPSLGTPVERYGRISPDGRRVLVIAEQGRLVNILLGNVETGEVQPLASRQRMKLASPSWSEDGKAVIWARAVDGFDEVVRHRVDGVGGPEVVYRLSRNEQIRELEGISGSDAFVVSVSVAEDRGELRLVTPSGGVAPRTLMGGVSVYRLRSSHDGRWLAATFLEGGTSSLRIIDLLRPERVVMVGTGSSAINANRFAWLGDNRSLVYRLSDRFVTATLGDLDRLEIIRRDTLGSVAVGGPSPGVLRRADDASLMDVSRSGDAVLGFLPRGGDQATSLVVETDWINRVRRRLSERQGNDQ